ncbi:MAG: hypothetical protein SFU56_22760 [Capsulimonadales bacterium]|nr:hypothetical protein [Capsulimonadales bacterium]
MKTLRSRPRLPGILPALFLLLIAAALPASAQRPRVLPPGSIVEGKSLSKWADLWWKRIYETPAAINPLLDTTGQFGGVGQKGPVFFLYGTFGGVVERTVTVKGEKYLFFPIINFENDPYPFGDPNAPYLDWTVAFLRAGAKANIDMTNYLDATVDGVPVTCLRYTNGKPVCSLFDHRERTKKPFTYTLPGNFEDIATFFGDPRFTGQEIGPAVSDGYWLMLTPLRRGWHTITFAATTSFGFDLRVSYRIHVVRDEDDCD